MVQDESVQGSGQVGSVQDVQMKNRRESESQVEEIGGVVVRARSVTVGSMTACLHKAYHHTIGAEQSEAFKTSEIWQIRAVRRA